MPDFHFFAAAWVWGVEILGFVRRRRRDARFWRLYLSRYIFPNN